MRSNALFLFLPFGISVMFYSVDVFLFHFSWAFHWVPKGVITQFWMLWFAQCLCEFRYRRVGVMIIFLSLVIAMHSAMDWAEIFFPLLLLVLWAMSYHAFFVISTPMQKRFFVLFSYGLLGFLMHVKMALEVPDPWAYFGQMKWIMILLVNMGLYALIGERLFLRIGSWVDRSYAFHT